MHWGSSPSIKIVFYVLFINQYMSSLIFYNYFNELYYSILCLIGLLMIIMGLLIVYTKSSVHSILYLIIIKINAKNSIFKIKVISVIYKNIIIKYKIICAELLVYTIRRPIMIINKPIKHKIL